MQKTKTWKYQFGTIYLSLWDMTKYYVTVTLKQKGPTFYTLHIPMKKEECTMDNQN